MCVNQVTKKSEQMSTLTEGSWQMPVLVGGVILCVFLSPLSGIWGNVLFAVPLTLMLVYGMVWLWGLCTFRQKFGALSSEYLHMRIREPMCA